MSSNGKKTTYNASDCNFDSMVENILQAFEKVGAYNAVSLHWYAEKHNELVKTAGMLQIDAIRFIAIVAVVSPNLRWDKNIVTACQIVSDMHMYGSANGRYMSYSANVKKAVRIYNGEKPESVLSGQKVTSFFHNLVNPYASGIVTIDRHAIHIAMYGISNDTPSGDLSVTKKAYSLFVGAYVHAASILDILPQDLQSATWALKASAKSL